MHKILGFEILSSEKHFCHCEISEISCKRFRPVQFESQPRRPDGRTSSMLTIPAKNEVTPKLPSQVSQCLTGLTQHQRGWKDAGWTVSRLQLCNDCCKCGCFCMTLREKARCILHHCILPASLSYARGQHGLHGARVMLFVRRADPLSGRIAGS